MADFQQVESGVKLSESCIWDAQRRYFDEMGVHAWNGAVPFFVTSNPFISQNTAKIIANYLFDLKAANKIDTNEPLYVLELGTGPGQFSYYCLRHLLELQAMLKMDDIKIVYVMSDFTKENLQFWQEHPLFKPYVEKGVLDFTVFDLEETKQLDLLCAGKTLGHGDIKNPLVCVANYIFDTVKHDVFHVENGQLFESLMTLEATPDNIDNNQPKKLENLKSHFTHNPAERDYYQHEVLDHVLQTYPSELDNASFLFPIGSFVALDMLKGLCHDQLCIVSTDKGYSNLFEIEGRGDPQIAFHGSLSMSVNFDAIAKYFKIHAGSSLLQTPREGIKTCVFLMGDEINNYPQMNQAVQNYVEGFAPADFFTFHRHFREADKVKLHTLLSHLRFGRWDPYAFSIFSQKIISELPESVNMISEGFLSGVDKLVENVYPMPGADDHYLNIGVMLHSLNHHGRAAELYALSREHYGDKFHNTFNMGLCMFMAEDFHGAREAFEKACLFTDSPEIERARDWLKDSELKCQK